jgi:hypothetical protein
LHIFLKNAVNLEILELTCMGNEVDNHTIKLIGEYCPRITDLNLRGSGVMSEGLQKFMDWKRKHDSEGRSSLDAFKKLNLKSCWNIRYKDFVDVLKTFSQLETFKVTSIHSYIRKLANKYCKKKYEIDQILPKYNLKTISKYIGLYNDSFDEDLFRYINLIFPRIEIVHVYHNYDLEYLNSFNNITHLIVTNYNRLLDGEALMSLNVSFFSHLRYLCLRNVLNVSLLQIILKCEDLVELVIIECFELKLTSYDKIYLDKFCKNSSTLPGLKRLETVRLHEVRFTDHYDLRTLELLFTNSPRLNDIKLLFITDNVWNIVLKSLISNGCHNLETLLVAFASHDPRFIFDLFSKPNIFPKLSNIILSSSNRELYLTYRYDYEDVISRIIKEKNIDCNIALPYNPRSLIKYILGI